MFKISNFIRIPSPLTILVSHAVNIVCLYSIANRCVSQNRNCVICEFQRVLDGIILICGRRCQFFILMKPVISRVENFVAENFAILTFFRHRRPRDVDRCRRENVAFGYFRCQWGNCVWTYIIGNENLLKLLKFIVSPSSNVDMMISFELGPLPWLV